MSADIDLQARIKVLGAPTVFAEHNGTQLRGWLFAWRDGFACVVFCVDLPTNCVTTDEATQHPTALAALRKLTSEFEKFNEYQKEACDDATA